MRYRLADHGRVFSTRDRGARLLADFVSAYSEDTDNVAVIDFSGVRSMTQSFADEFVGELLVRSTRGDFEAPRLENLAPLPRRAVERSARVRGLPAEMVDLLVDDYVPA